MTDMARDGAGCVFDEGCIGLRDQLPGTGNNFIFWQRQVILFVVQPAGHRCAEKGINAIARQLIGDTILSGVGGTGIDRQVQRDQCGCQHQCHAQAICKAGFCGQRGTYALAQMPDHGRSDNRAGE